MADNVYVKDKRKKSFAYAANNDGSEVRHPTDVKLIKEEWCINIFLNNTPYVLKALDQSPFHR